MPRHPPLAGHAARRHGLRHQANVAGNRRRFLHRDPAGLQFGYDVQGAPAADRTRRAGTKRGPTITIIPCTHFVWPGNFTAPQWGSWAKTYQSAKLPLRPKNLLTYSDTGIC